MQSHFAAIAERLSTRFLGRNRAAASFRHSESGQALVEVALITPVFLLVLAGAIDFGQYAYDGILVGNAAQAAVQYGAHNNDTSVNVANIRSAATTEAQGITLLTPTVSTICACADTGAATTAVSCFVTPACTGTTHRIQFVQVTTSANYFVPLMPIAVTGLPNPLTITRTALMQVSP
jgi:Flp pilus assembly protein TadG